VAEEKRRDGKILGFHQTSKMVGARMTDFVQIELFQKYSIVSFFLSFSLSFAVRTIGQLFPWRRDTQNNGTWHKDTKHNDIGFNDTRYIGIIKLSIKMILSISA
jgi:hypothetical protein